MDTFYLSKNRIIEVNFTDSKSILSITKRDWKEIANILRRELDLHKNKKYTLCGCKYDELEIEFIINKSI